MTMHLLHATTLLEYSIYKPHYVRYLSDACQPKMIQISRPGMSLKMFFTPLRSKPLLAVKMPF